MSCVNSPSNSLRGGRGALAFGLALEPAGADGRSDWPSLAAMAAGWASTMGLSSVQGRGGCEMLARRRPESKGRTSALGGFDVGRGGGRGRGRGTGSGRRGGRRRRRVVPGTGAGGRHRTRSKGRREGRRLVVEVVRRRRSSPEPRARGRGRDLRSASRTSREMHRPSCPDASPITSCQPRVRRDYLEQVWSAVDERARCKRS